VVKKHWLVKSEVHVNFQNCGGVGYEKWEGGGRQSKSQKLANRATNGGSF
jgi:hypothetical protein